MKLTMIALATALFLTGCHHSPASSEDVTFNPDVIKVLQPVAGQRFTPTTSILVSYDTLTDQICRTYDWGKTSDLRMATCSSLSDLTVRSGH